MFSIFTAIKNWFNGFIYGTKEEQEDIEMYVKYYLAPEEDDIEDIDHNCSECISLIEKYRN